MLRKNGGSRATSRMRVFGGAVRGFLAVWSIVAAGCAGNVDTKTDIVGTWTRESEGVIVQELAFTLDGKYDTHNPATGVNRESGNYAVDADGKLIDFRSSGGVSYTWQVRFKGKDAITMWEEDGGRRRFENTYRRKK